MEVQVETYRFFWQLSLIREVQDVRLSCRGVERRQRIKWEGRGSGRDFGTDSPDKWETYEIYTIKKCDV